MNAKQRRTLKLVFAQPAPTELPWSDISSMLKAVGVRSKERAGSRIALVKDGEVMIVRRPQPNPLAVRATVTDVAAFLKTVGVKP